jgi:serine/threonine protein kinase/Tol biopolymer transport system component
MPLTPGARLGPYEIVSAIGAGGMGEVYKARDTRLDRTVAIKILPSADPELRARFKAEAKAIAALQHPHICTLHDVGQQDGTDYLVLEYLEGKTLADHLKRGPLKFDDVLKIAIEIADALDKAHRAGIVHRDLKPANVMLTKSGVKLLDFGLAKLRPQIAAVGGFSTAVTQSTPPLTATGSIFGTLPYMAPEQLEGRDADARTDIFALGVVIYEIATGRRAFEGSSQASLIGAILKNDPPPIRTLQPLAPPNLERVVRKCLAKDAEDRWQSARDVATELQSVAKEQAQPATAAPLPGGQTRRERWAWPVAALLLASTVAFLLNSFTRPPPPRDPVRFSVPLPVDVGRVDIAWGSPPAISADGRQIAYVGSRPDGTTQIYIRKLDQFEGSPVRGTEDGLGPFFSPNGQWLGFFSGGKLKKVAIGGGSPITLCDGYSRGATWGTDDTIIFTPHYNGGLSRVSAAGGTPEVVTSLDPSASERSHRWPHFLPGGNAFLFTAGAINFNEAQIVVRQLDTGSQHVVVQAGTGAQYAAGHVMFARGGSLLAVPFDIRRLEATGPPVPVLENVAMARLTGTSHFAISPGGSLVYVAGAMGPSNNTLVWVDREGRAGPVTALQRGYTEVRISPDGKRIALVIETLGEGTDVWIYEVSRGTLTRFTFGPGLTQAPIWSPEGKHLIYGATRRKDRDLFRKAVDGSGAEEPILAADSAGARRPGSWSPDGKWVVFADERAGIFVLPLDGPRTPKPFAVAFREDQPQFSPDGRWIAYRSPESGRSEVYVRPFPGPGGKWQVSTDGGDAPIWNRNGRELFYRNGDRVMAAAVSLGQTFAVGPPRELFRGAYDASSETSYDVAPDGQHFLMIRREQSSAPAHLNVVLDWSTEFRRVTAAR